MYIKYNSNGSWSAWRIKGPFRIVSRGERTKGNGGTRVHVSLTQLKGKYLQMQMSKFGSICNQSIQLVRLLNVKRTNDWMTLRYLLKFNLHFVWISSALTEWMNISANRWDTIIHCYIPLVYCSPIYSHSFKQSEPKNEI